MLYSLYNVSAVKVLNHPAAWYMMIFMLFLDQLPNPPTFITQGMPR